jgi:hypothetical protein
MTRLGQMAGSNVRSTIGTAAGAAGLMRAAIDHPILTTGAVMGVYGALAYGGVRNQSIPAGPTSQIPRSGYFDSTKNNYDMGASGDLVFALHRLNH